jgi:hypothetical protein
MKTKGQNYSVLRGLQFSGVLLSLFFTPASLFFTPASLFFTPASLFFTPASLFFTPASLCFALLSLCFALPCHSVEPHSTVIKTLPDDVKIDVGARMQMLFLQTDNDLISERDKRDFMVRRARIRVKGQYSDWLKVAIQSEMSEEPKSSSADARIIDAYLHIDRSKETQFFLGQHLVPSLRQNITHAGSLLSIDRPSISSKSLTWGTKAKTRFSTQTMSNTNAGLKGTVGVRDIGITAFGHLSHSENTHFKYYIGSYDGAESAAAERYTARAQLNLGDAESSYYNASSYKGKKSTLAFGLSIDSQSSVARNSFTEKQVNYQLLSADFFTEKPIGKGSATFECAYIQLDLDDAQSLSNQALSSVISNIDVRSAQGEGFYLQGSYTINSWQPWFGWEQWESNASDKSGSFSNTRLGISYYLEGDKANIKLGLENNQAEQAFSNSIGDDDSSVTIAVGLFITI